MRQKQAGIDPVLLAPGWYYPGPGTSWHVYVGGVKRYVLQSYDNEAAGFGSRYVENLNAELIVN